MRLSKFTPSLCAVEGGVFGGMYFYHNMFISCQYPMRFGSSFSLRHPNLAIASATRARRRGDLVEKDTTGSPAGGVGPAGCGSGLGVVGSRTVAACFALAWLTGLLACFAALAWFAALVPFPVWVLRLNRVPPLLSVWFIASRGHHFGLGGLNCLFLLVG